MSRRSLLVAGPNLTIDRTATLAELRPGEVLRARDVAVTAGGKGVNVVRSAQALGAVAVLVGFVPGRIGAAAAAMLADEGVELRAVPVAGEIRSTAVLLEDGGRTTVLNEPGPAVTPADWRALEAALVDCAAGAGLLACSGSIPPGGPADAYGRLVALGRRHGLPAIVDASGPLLAGALPAQPDVVTPNLAEAEALLLGRADEGVEVDPTDARERAGDAAARLRVAGARTAVVTAGSAGVAVDGATGAWWLPAPRVVAVNPIGAGDAFVGGYAAAVLSGAGPRHAIAAAIGAASASVEQALAGAVDPVRAAALTPRVA